MATLDRTAILAAQDLGSELIDVPEWKGSVRIRVMTAREKAEIQRLLFTEEMVIVDGKPELRRKPNQAVNIRTVLVGFTLINEDGTRMFMDEEVDLLASKSAAVIERLFTEAQRVNGMAEDAVEKAKND